MEHRCNLCNRRFNAQGYGRHRIACIKANEKVANVLREAGIIRAINDDTDPGPSTPSRSNPVEYLGGNMTYETSESLSSCSVLDPPVARLQNVDEHHDIGNAVDFTTVDQNTISDDVAQEDRPCYPSGKVMEDIPDIDSIYTEYHPSSGRLPEVKPLHKYNYRRFPETIPADYPWKPFKNRLDFEVLEFAMELGFNHKQLKRYISLFHRAIAAAGNEEENFTVQSWKEATNLWELASVRRVKFQKFMIEQQYQQEKEPRSFEFWYREPWDWALEIIKEPRLKNHIVWDPERNYKWDGTTWERIYDEPWSGDAWWRAQTTLTESGAPQGSKLVPLILYADKSKLSSFGTAMGHPIIARLASLPASIRNSEGVGGGSVVGWLPIVKEMTAESGKPAFVQFKHAVYHSSFKKFLEKIAQLSNVGSNSKCGDEILRPLWPFILILAADYEEFSVMTLIRGHQGLFPCPVCLVPKKNQWNLSMDFESHTQEDTRNFFFEGITLPTRELREQHFKSKSLRPVENAFWSVNLTDLHSAVSYDCLHSDDNGLWEDHLFPIFKNLAKELGRAATSSIDAHFRSVPRWNNLNHFDSVMNITFNDGSKNKDISKIFLYASQAIFTRNQNSEGYHLLRCLRHYLNVRTYADFDLHTESSLAAAQVEIEQNLYLAFTEYFNFIGILDALTAGVMDEQTDQKSWNFPKMHLRKHLVRDIRDKGVTRNYSTKPNEKMHGPIRKIYHRRTNFKDVSDQILRAVHHIAISQSIRNELNLLDDCHKSGDSSTADSSSESDLDNEDSMSSPTSMTRQLNYQDFTNYRTLKAPQPLCSFDQFEALHKSDAFLSFRTRLASYLRINLSIFGINLPVGAQRLALKGSDKLMEWHSLEVQYTCSADWELKADILRCSPHFHHHPRYNCVLVQKSPTDSFFARLLALFMISINDRNLNLALVSPFEPVYKHRNRKISDKELELLRLRETPAANTTFVSIYSIIRGAVIIPSGEEATSHASDYFLFDVLDADMFLRGREILGSLLETSTAND